MLSWWVLCYIVAIVGHESSPSPTDNSRIRCILLDSTNYSYDPVSELSSAVSKLRFVVSNNRIIFGGLPLLNTALGRISQLPRSTKLALDLRAPFRSLIL